MWLGGVHAIDDIEDDDERRLTMAVALDMAGDNPRLMHLRAQDVAGLIDRLMTARRR